MKKIKLIHCLLLLLLSSAAEARPMCANVGSGSAIGQNYGYFTTWCCENNGSFYGVTVYHSAWNYNDIWASVQLGCGELNSRMQSSSDINLDRERENAEDLLMKKVDF